MSIRLRRRISTGSMPNAARRLVHQPFEREGDDRPRHAAIRRHRAGVGDDAARTAVVVRGRRRARHLRHRHQRLDAAGGRESRNRRRYWRRCRPTARSAWRPCRTRLRSAMYWSRLWKPAIRFSRRSSVQATELCSLRASHTSSDVFRRQRHLLAEAAADVGRDHAQVGFRHAEHVGDRGARQMRHLRRAGQRDAAGRRVVGRVPGARLHRRGVLPARARFDLDDLCGAAQTASKSGVLTRPSTMTLSGASACTSGAPSASASRASITGVVSSIVDLDLIDDVLGLFLARARSRRRPARRQSAPRRRPGSAGRPACS